MLRPVSTAASSATVSASRTCRFVVHAPLAVIDATSRHLTSTYEQTLAQTQVSRSFAPVTVEAPAPTSTLWTRTQPIVADATRRESRWTRHQAVNRQPWCERRTLTWSTQVPVHVKKWFVLKACCEIYEYWNTEIKKQYRQRECGRCRLLFTTFRRFTMTTVCNVSTTFHRTSTAVHFVTL